MLQLIINVTSAEVVSIHNTNELSNLNTVTVDLLVFGRQLLRVADDAGSTGAAADTSLPPQGFGLRQLLLQINLRLTELTNLIPQAISIYK